MVIGTREALVRSAENLMRTKGYAAFSYADLAEDIGIRKASIHHHFPTKEDLGVAIVEEYIERVRSGFRRIDQQHSTVADKVTAYFSLFQASSNRGLLPMCGALAAEMKVLPVELQKLTQRFFDLQLTWLRTTLEEGVAAGDIPTGRGAKQKAFLVLSLLEGASFVNWATKGKQALDETVVLSIIEQP